MQRREFLGGITVGGLAFSKRKFDIPADLLREPESIPAFWVSALSDVREFLRTRIRSGTVEAIGTSAGGRKIPAVFYGQPRRGRGTTTYSGSLGFGSVRAYLGPDHAKKVYLGIAGVHGAEFEGIAGVCNALSVLETGQDLRGKAWPDLAAAAKALDRVIFIPVMNPDGRERVPPRMLRHRGTDLMAAEYLNTGGKFDSSLVGWPQCKEHIPLDFSTVQFPGGYPNDAGVNIQHDDFLGARQPETQALFEMAARERPDLTLNMHTGADFPQMLREFNNPIQTARYPALYRAVMTKLAEEKFTHTGDAAVEANIESQKLQPFNLDAALSMHCGSLSALVESPSHSFTTAKRNGAQVFFTPDQLIDAQLICHQEAMRFLVQSEAR